MKNLGKMALAVLVFVTMQGATCRPPPVVVEAPDTDQCDEACAHLRGLGCPEGDPLEDGTTCEQFCTDTHKNGIYLNPVCVMQIQTCPEIDACTESR